MEMVDAPVWQAPGVTRSEPRFVEKMDEKMEKARAMTAWSKHLTGAA